MDIKTARNITELSDQYTRLRKANNARAIGVKQDLRDACLDALVKETIERAREVVAGKTQG